MSTASCWTLPAASDLPPLGALSTPGAQQDLSLVLRTVLAPGDEVIVPTPTYFFDGAIREAGATPAHVPSHKRDGWARAFLLVDCSRLGETPADIDHVLLRNGIATVRGADLHGPDTHVRLTFGANEQVLAELVHRLGQTGRGLTTPEPQENRWQPAIPVRSAPSLSPRPAWPGGSPRGRRPGRG